MRRPSGSSLHLLHRCAASHVLPQINTDSEPAQRGRRAAAEKERERKRDGDWAPEVTFYLNAETGEARLVGSGLGRNYEGLGENEVPMTADAIGEDGDTVLILDDKMKRTFEAPASRHPQLRALALAACRSSGKSRARVTWIKWDPAAYDRGDWVQTWSDTAEIDSFELDVTAEEIRDSWRAWKRAKAIMESGKTPDVHPGEWCRWCPALKACPSSTALVRAAVQAPVSFVDEIRDLAPEQVGLAWLKAKAALSLLHSLVAECEAMAREHPIELPDGRVLQLVEGRAVERVVDGRKAYEVLSELLGEKYALQAVEVESSKDAIKRAASQARKDNEEIANLWSSAAELERALLGTLRDEGAIQKVQSAPTVKAVSPKEEKGAA